MRVAVVEAVFWGARFGIGLEECIRGKDGVGGGRGDGTLGLGKIRRLYFDRNDGFGVGKGAFLLLGNTA